MGHAKECVFESLENRTCKNLSNYLIIHQLFMFIVYYNVRYQEGSNLPICIDTVHLKLCNQLLNQFWEL